MIFLKVSYFKHPFQQILRFAIVNNGAHYSLKPALMYYLLQIKL